MLPSLLFVIFGWVVVGIADAIVHGLASRPGAAVVRPLPFVGPRLRESRNG